MNSRGSILYARNVSCKSFTEIEPNNHKDLYQAARCEEAHCACLIVLDYCVHNEINHICNKLQIKVDTVLVATTNQRHAAVQLQIAVVWVCISFLIKCTGDIITMSAVLGHCAIRPGGRVYCADICE